MTRRLKILANSYLDHIRIAVAADDRGAPFRDFFDNWNAFRSETDHHRSRGDRPRWFNNPSATKRMAMLESLDFVSAGAAGILSFARQESASYNRLYRARDTNVRLMVDHAVPIGVMADLLFDSAIGPASELSLAGIRAHLERWYRLGLLSHAENGRLNAAGLASRMPLNWDRVDPFARYRAAGIAALK